ncbi:major pollen allergen Ole e 10-like [Mangifera indica]|uniref:major pollen allergen Ole e 10-like n=1 Tax=Mangifera indica TaxID=29780 RepID=UPI001CFAAC7D|nr:major pollen allergen Ole e 10-like [Mangifera indica]
MAMASPIDVFLVSMLVLNLLTVTTSQAGDPAMPNQAETKFCVPKPEVDDKTLQTNIDYACGSNVVDCNPIKVGGDCFEPDTLKSHATFAMHAYYVANGRNDHNCDFASSGMLTTQNPSYDRCVYQ